MRLAPIALFVYNRPSHTKRTIESLRNNELARESDLFIFSDAPKDLDAAAKVDEVRGYIKTIEGFKSVSIIERDVNFGLARSIIDGVTRVVRARGRIIVLEDDLIVSPAFLGYMNESLERYAGNERVMQISGYMPPVEVDAGTGACFLPVTTSWGWGTWQRAWDLFDASAQGYDELKKDRFKRKAFDLDGAYPYFQMLESQLRGEVNSWAIRWWLTVFLRNGLVLYPSRSLVVNSGFDGSGVHCGTRELAQDKGMKTLKIQLPDKVEMSASVYKMVISFMRRDNSKGLRGWIRNFL